MMQIANLEFPTTCPVGCQGKLESWYQGCLCSRCPVYNVPDIVSADSYNPIWAAEFHAFIYGGPQPKLLFNIVESDELLNDAGYKSIPEMTMGLANPVVWAYEFVNETGREFDNDRVVEWFKASIEMGQSIKDFNTKLRDAVVGFNYSLRDGADRVLELKDNGFSCAITYGDDIIWDSENNEFGDDVNIIVYKSVARYVNILHDRIHDLNKGLDGTP